MAQVPGQGRSELDEFVEERARVQLHLLFLEHVHDRVEEVRADQALVDQQCLEAVTGRRVVAFRVAD